MALQTKQPIFKRQEPPFWPPFWKFSTPKKQGLVLDVGRQSCKVDWSAISDHIKQNYEPVVAWFLLIVKKDSSSFETQEKIALEGKQIKLDPTRRDYIFRNLDGNTTFIVRLTWTTRSTGPDCHHQHYLDDRFASTSAEFRTAAGIQIRAPKNFLDDPVSAWQELHDEIRKFGGREETINIVVYGYAGAGKTSLLNVLETCFSSAKFIQSKMPNFRGKTRSGQHVTLEFSSRDIGAGKAINIYDIWGIDDDNYPNNQFTAFLDGRITEFWNHKWAWPDDKKEHSKCIRAHPELRHKMHSAILMIPAQQALEGNRTDLPSVRINSLIDECDAVGITPIIGISKVDKLDAELKGDGFKTVFSSEPLVTAYDNISECLGFGLMRVFPCQFYTNEHDRNIYIEIVAMQCLLEAIKKAVEWKAKLFKRLEHKEKPKTKEDEFYEALQNMEIEDLEVKTRPVQRKLSPPVSPVNSKISAVEVPEMNPLPDTDAEECTAPEIEGQMSFSDADLKDAFSWDAQSVGSWLQREGFGQYREGFIKADINGAILLELEIDGLKVLGVNMSLDRSKIMAKIKELVRAQKSQKS